MIITRTPFRISFIGGGTDLPSFCNYYTGATFSATINKYMYIAVNRRFEKDIRVGYSTTEIVKKTPEIKHDIARNVLKMYGIDYGYEIVSISDIPSRGSGLGSSSAYAVGLINAISNSTGTRLSKYALAKKASHVEIDLCGKTMGYQDQFAVAHGGFNLFYYTENGVKVIANEFNDISENFILFHTGWCRKAESVLKDQDSRTEDNITALKRMANMASWANDCYTRGNIAGLGRLIKDNWEYKKSLSSYISNSEIDSIIETGNKAGAYGAKLLGAGGGGFVLFCVPKDKRKHIISTVKIKHGLEYVEFSFTDKGSEVIYE